MEKLINNPFRSIVVCLGILIIFMGCTKPVPTLEGFDKSVWQADKNGCGNQRSKYADVIRTQKDQLLALTEMDIVKTLGRADENELYKRNQKFYYYYITPSTACDSTVQKPLKLIIRFNAMGLAKEVSVE